MSNGLATSIINSLHLLGLTSGGYIGYKYGNKTKEYTLKTFPIINRYYSEYIKTCNFKHISEPVMCNVFGSFVGIGLGYWAWQIAIPVTIYNLSNDYYEYTAEGKNVKQKSIFDYFKK